MPPARASHASASSSLHATNTAPNGGTRGMVCPTRARIAKSGAKSKASAPRAAMVAAVAVRATHVVTCGERLQDRVARGARHVDHARELRDREGFGRMPGEMAQDVARAKYRG